MSGNPQWPDLPFAAWSDTCDTLQLWTQIAGKVVLALTPLVNHWWNVTFRVTARGLAARSIQYQGRTFDIVFDFANHRLDIESSDGRVESLALKPMPVADFYAEFMNRLRCLDIDVHIWTTPCEIENCISFDQDRTHAQYDPVYVQRFQQALLQANRVMTDFRAHFLGKVSPVHFFWGSFDLAVTRFSGRPAPLLTTSATPGLSVAVAREAYSHEVSSVGFWPGGGPIDYPAYYSYAYPEPAGFAAAKVRPAAAFYFDGFGQFILPYDAVRQAADPEAVLMEFLQSTYDAAADLGKWDRAALECALGEKGKVRTV
jgi:hypothetical protein